MEFPPPDIVRAELERSGQTVEFLRITQDGRAMVCRCSHGAYAGQIEPWPMLFVHFCLKGGGPIDIKTNYQTIDETLSEGSIGVIPPNSEGLLNCPAMTVISFGIAVSCVIDTFGAFWPEKLQSRIMSQTFRDPLVEATMIDMGHTREGAVSDAGLLHAAQMIVHQLLDQPSAEDTALRETTPLSKATLSRIDQMIAKSLERPVTVAQMADLAGMSRFHFSRRFKAATGQSPLQYAIQKKLDHAAQLLERDSSASVLHVAQMVGFNNPAHFSRAFRRQFGLAPRSWKTRKRAS